ncbi:hypothetical protein KAZ01_04210 [Candidatus Gracilibacteria bacterium]|nr:hypothetical protein [Candidatus Gracilibacteria bacterium]
MSIQQRSNNSSSSSSGKFIFILIIVAVIIFGTYIFYNSKKSVDSGKMEDSSKEMQTLEQAKKARYEAEKKKIEEENVRYDFYNEAVEKLDESICEKVVGNDKLKTECFDNVYSAKADKEKNISYCKKISNVEFKNNCEKIFYYDEALKKGNKAICEKIVGDNKYKKSCIENIIFTKISDKSYTGSTEICNTLQKDSKNLCVKTIENRTNFTKTAQAIESKNIDVCSSITDISLKKICNDSINYSLAMKSQNIVDCKKINDSAKVKSCESEIINNKDDTLIQQANTGLNVTLCNQISSVNKKTSCSNSVYLKLAIKQVNIELCSKINDETMKKQCKDAINYMNSQKK